MAEDGGLVELAGAHQAVKERVASQKIHSYMCIHMYYIWRECGLDGGDGSGVGRWM